MGATLRTHILTGTSSSLGKLETQLVVLSVIPEGVSTILALSLWPTGLDVSLSGSCASVVLVCELLRGLLPLLLQLGPRQATSAGLSSSSTSRTRTTGTSSMFAQNGRHRRRRLW